MEREAHRTREEDKRVKDRYLKELDRLFSGKGDGEREEFLKRLHLSGHKKDFQRLLLEFYQRFGLPDEARDLLLFLDATDKEILRHTFEKIRERFQTFNLTEKQSVIAKLKALQFSTKDESLSFKTEKLLKELTL